MTLVLPQSKFEAIPPKDMREDTFLVEADVLHQILGSERNDFSPVVLMDLILKLLESQ